jgi:hypothetical protein
VKLLPLVSFTDRFFKSPHYLSLYIGVSILRGFSLEQHFLVFSLLSVRGDALKVFVMELLFCRL